MAYNKFNLIKNLPDRFLMPDSPEEWNSEKYTMFRTFELNRVDIEIIMEAINAKYVNAKGNTKYTKERLLGTLRSMHYVANAKNIHQHQYPKTWKIVQFWWIFKRRFQWLFNTKNYKRQIFACEIMKEID